MHYTYRKRFRQFLNLFLQRPDVIEINMSIPNYMDKITRNKICERDQTEFSTHITQHEGNNIYKTNLQRGAPSLFHFTPGSPST